MAEKDTESLQAVAPKPMRKSYIDLISECDSFPYDDSDPNVYFQHVSTYFQLIIPPCPRPLGYLLPSVALTLQGIEGWEIDEAQKTLTLVLPRRRTSSTLFSNADDPAQDEQQDQTEEQQRSVIFARTAAAMRATGHFQVLKKWRDELYPIYWRPPPASSNSPATGEGSAPRPRAELLASVERSASPLFGIVTYGCHMTAYFYRDADNKSPSSMAIWIPRRARTKGTYPGMLDQTVAGGIATGETAFECLVREAAEEASLPEELVRRKARSVSTVSYFHIRDERAGGETRLLQPEVQFCYDLDVTGEDVQPQPGDDEVEAFELMSVKEVLDALVAGEFKPNCASVQLDFMVRHGIITAENEADYVEIITRLHRRLEFPTM